MSNMSYCRFENTLSDLRDCHNEMCNDNVRSNLSRSESVSFAELVELRKEIAEMYEGLNYQELIWESREQ